MHLNVQFNMPLFYFLNSRSIIFLVAININLTPLYTSSLVIAYRYTVCNTYYLSTHSIIFLRFLFCYCLKHITNFITIQSSLPPLVCELMKFTVQIHHDNIDSKMMIAIIYYKLELKWFPLFSILN